MRFKHSSKIIRWWMGTDVLKTFHNPYKKTSLQYYTLYANRLFNWVSKPFITEHWVVHESLKPYLEKKGITVSKVVIDPPQKFVDFKKTEHDGINILYYHPRSKNQYYTDWVYCFDIIKELIKKFPEYNFIEVSGKQDMSVMYQWIDLYIRPSRWDGTPRMILECIQLDIPYYWDETFKPTIEKVSEWVEMQVITSDSLNEQKGI